MNFSRKFSNRPEVEYFGRQNLQMETVVNGYSTSGLKTGLFLHKVLSHMRFVRHAIL